MVRAITHTPRQQMALRLGFGFFAIYLSVMTGAMLFPAVFDRVMGTVGLRWPEVPSPELILLANMSLCGLVPTTYMAARTALFGEWTALNRGFFIWMLVANLLINFWTLSGSSSFIHILAGDFVVVIVLLCLAIAVKPSGD